ncbi:MAG: glycosyltransferase [Mariprofundaceae bacterium]|nr:glycosyltransferase [Mariprofundaceae bacterium]
MGKSMDISIVVACYNEAAHIRKSLPELVSVLDKTGLMYELIIIDDCSQDNTVDVLRQIIAQLGVAADRVTLKVHAANVGRGGTVSEGFRLATGELVGYLDIDLEIGPWYLLPALAKISAEQLDGVIAQRIYKLDFHATVLVRQWMSIMFRKLSHATLKLPLTDVAGGFKFFKRDKILPILDDCRSEHWFWDTELVYIACRKGLKIDEIPVLFLRRPVKKSTVRIIPDTLRQLSETYALLQRTKMLSFDGEDYPAGEKAVFSEEKEKSHAEKD